MFSKALLSAAILATSVLSAALPATTNILDIALQRGIDVHGPIPADATAVNGGWSFEAGSDAAIWVQAQSSITATSDTLEKRTQSGLRIGLWTAHGCNGAGFFIDNVTYDKQNVAPASNTYGAVQVIGRIMRANEQLDVSSRSGGDLCAVFQASVRNNVVGCIDQPNISCFRLTAH